MAIIDASVVATNALHETISLPKAVKAFSLLQYNATINPSRMNAPEIQALNDESLLRMWSMLLSMPDDAFVRTAWPSLLASSGGQHLMLSDNEMQALDTFQRVTDAYGPSLKLSSDAMKEFRSMLTAVARQRAPDMAVSIENYITRNVLQLGVRRGLKN
jgi:hypothetical protein